MKWLLYLIFLVSLLSTELFSQQLLTLEGGANYLVYHRQNFDDEYLNIDITNPKGFEIGLTLKLNKENKMDGKILVNFTNSSFNVKSNFNDDLRFYGDADVAITLNALRFAYLFDYSVGRRTKFFFSGGPSFIWLYNARMNGYLNFNEVRYPEDKLIETLFDGPQEDMHSKGLFGLVAKSGFSFPINRKTSFQVSAQLFYDFSWHSRKELQRVINNSLNTMVHIDAMVGLTYDIGKVISDEDWGGWEN